ncbi:TUBGCP3 [Cordylochernes scorpioides]|uniref:TUBGCP3 n=1 Tax=Cordylochernes scorpioides TaxID=51811 RepID=A0ABY6KBC3_9ARAC|nr:TUBGCP3 [Cordylochernes scorpioides]
MIIMGSIGGSRKTLVLRLCELGWLYQRVVKLSLVAALRDELHQYYQILALMDSQMEVENGRSLTLRRLLVCTLEPFTRLRTLACLVDACRDEKGGALASILYSFLWHGDPTIKDLIKSILSQVIQPIYRILSHWIFCGELEDKYDEFFVAANMSVSDTALWQEKYSLRKDMVPSFFTMEQASKILSTGKAINFLREVCHDHSCVQAEKVSKGPLDATTVESLIRGEREGVFQTLLESTYVSTSKHVLRVLHSQYHFMAHLGAVRSYLLLGQGDFVRHLMDLLEGELSKPANLLYLHNLSGILDSAVRATNAQFDSPDILQRLDVRLLDVTTGDTGWDVFSLDYHVDGPIGTVFTSQCMVSYLRLFNWLWRAKRMEYVLATLWKTHSANARTASSHLPQLAPVVHQAHCLLSAMVHLVQQMQYYIAFENQSPLCVLNQVMECSWAELVQKVNAAQDLDQVIGAHVRFLDTLLSRALLDPASKIYPSAELTATGWIGQSQTFTRECLDHGAMINESYTPFHDIT